MPSFRHKTAKLRIKLLAEIRISLLLLGWMIESLRVPYLVKPGISADSREMEREGLEGSGLLVPGIWPVLRAISHVTELGWHSLVNFKTSDERICGPNETCWRAWVHAHILGRHPHQTCHSAVPPACKLSREVEKQLSFSP